MSAKITYKGDEIVNLTEDGTKTLKTGGKYCEGDIIVENKKDIITEPLSVTENGTYTAESGKAFNPVVVDVPEQIKTLDSVPDTKVTDIIVVSGDYYLWKEGA